MNANQHKQASVVAAARIASGEDPQGLVHVLYYPADYAPGEDEIQGLSTALPADTDLSRGGYTAGYFTLAELAA